MKPENIESRYKKKRDAIFSAAMHTLILAATAAVTLYLRQHYAITGFWGAIVLGAALLDLGICIPIWILLKERLKEIEGGEEDAAAQY